MKYLSLFIFILLSPVAQAFQLGESIVLDCKLANEDGEKKQLNDRYRVIEVDPELAVLELLMSIDGRFDNRSDIHIKQLFSQGFTVMNWNASTEGTVFWEIKNRLKVFWNQPGTNARLDVIRYSGAQSRPYTSEVSYEGHCSIGLF